MVARVKGNYKKVGGGTMKWESGVVTGLAPIAGYMAGYNKQMTIKCFVNQGWYIVQYHNGRQSGRIGWTKDKDEANGVIRDALKRGYKRFF